MYQYIYNEKAIISKAEFPEIAGFGIQIPANGFTLEQPLVEKKGLVWVYQNSQAIQLADNRGLYYSTETGKQVTFEELGDIPKTLTKQAPTDQYDKWNGKKWVTDIEAEKEALKLVVLAQRDEFFTIASEKIAPLQDAMDLDEATDQETTQLKAWKKYRIQLNRVEQQPDFPNNIEWPVQPH